MDLANSYGALILAGGKSSRMNHPKPWLPLNDGSSFLEHLVKLYADCGVKNIAAVINHEYYSGKWIKQIVNVEQYSLIIENYHVDKGRLYSIKLGLENLTGTDFIYIQNIDNPLIDKTVIDTLHRNACSNGATIPTFKGKGGHPVLISKEVGESISRGYNPSDTLHDVIDQFKRKYIEVESKFILMNLNTHSEYIKAMSEFG